MIETNNFQWETIAFSGSNAQKNKDAVTNKTV